MKQFYLSLLLLVSFGLFAQDEPGTQTGTIDNCTTCNLVAGNLAAATPSAIPFCTGAGSNDVFYTFTAPAPLQVGDQIGIKVTIQNAVFDAAIEILDNSNTSLECSDSVTGVGDEDLVEYGFTAGDTYHIRIYAVDGVIGSGDFDICIQQLPELFVRNNYVGFGLSGDGYTINDLVNREGFTNPAPVERTGWLFVCDQDGTESYVEVNGTNPNINLNTVPGVCYDKTFTVYVRVMIGGQWCGYGEGRQIFMEPAPTSVVQSSYCGNTYAVNSGILAATFFGTNADTEWEFSTDNGNTVFTVMSDPGSSVVFLDEIPQLRYNKVYQVRVRANVCGLWGPWSDPCPIITELFPYTELLSGFCNTVVPSNATWVCNPVANADTYVWQVAPIECGDTDFVPTGPAQVFFVTGGSTVFSLAQADIVPGQCYRVGVKAFVGEQEGDYGYFCEVQASGGVATLPPVSIESTEITALPGTIGLGDLYPNPSSNGAFMVALENSSGDHLISVEIYSATGTLVHKNDLNTGGSNTLSVEPQSSLPAGMYFVKILDSRNKVIASEKLIVE